MPLSLYEITIPVYIKNLQILSALLTKSLTSTKTNESTLLASRLIADMDPLPAQIQRASDTAKFVAVRLGSVPNVSWADDEKTFEQLQERITKTITFLEAVDPKCMDGVEEKEVEFWGRKMNGRDYVLGFAVPNFYFHFVTAFALLRKEGVEVGKLDYMGVKKD